MAQSFRLSNVGTYDRVAADERDLEGNYTAHYKTRFGRRKLLVILGFGVLLVLVFSGSLYRSHPGDTSKSVEVSAGDTASGVQGDAGGAGAIADIATPQGDGESGEPGQDAIEGWDGEGAKDEESKKKAALDDGQEEEGQTPQPTNPVADSGDSPSTEPGDIHNEPGPEDAQDEDSSHAHADLSSPHPRTFIPFQNTDYTPPKDGKGVSVTIHYKKPSGNQGPALSPPDCPIHVQYTDDPEKADVVVYNSDSHQGLTEDERLSLRASRPWQAQTIWGSEAAPNRPTLARHHNLLAEGRYNETMDLEMTYRLDGAVPAVYAYSYFRFDAEPLPWEEKRQDRMMAMFATNCRPKNDRNAIMQYLVDTIPDGVDSFGWCKNNRNPSEELDRLGLRTEVGDQTKWNIKITLSKRYKFVFAVENCIDPDYVTEKFFQPMEFGSVPIVLWPKEFVGRFAPYKDSVINLADYLPASAVDFNTVKSGGSETLSDEAKEGMDRFIARITHLSSEEGRAEYERMIGWKKKDWKHTPFGYVVQTGRQKYDQDCRLAGAYMGYDWALPASKTHVVDF